MSTITSFNINDLNWNPVQFNVIGGAFDLIKSPIYFNNGVKFNLYPFLNNINDFSFNNKSGIFLTEFKNNSDIIKDKEQPLIQNNLSYINTIISDNNGKIYKKNTLSNSVSSLLASDSIVSFNDQLTFNFTSDNKVYIEDVSGYVLTNGGLGVGQVYFNQKTQPIADNQLWDYIIGENIIVLFGNNTNFGQVLKQDKATLSLLLAPYNPIPSKTLPWESFLYLNSYDIKDRTYDTVSDSYIVKYDSTPINDQKSLA